jgi:hypothetical protein
MLRSSFAALAVTTLVVGQAVAQTPDFSGSWKLNTEKSDPPPQMGGGGGSAGDRPAPPPGGASGGGGGASGGRGMMTPTEIFITQLTSRISMDVKSGDRNRTVSYNLDGTESRNPGMMGNEFVTTSKWVDNTIVTTGKNTFKTPMGEMTVETTEIRSLSEDGKTMTIEMTTVSPRGTFKRKTVYDKQ